MTLTAAAERYVTTANALPPPLSATYIAPADAAGAISALNIHKPRLHSTHATRLCITATSRHLSTRLARLPLPPPLPPALHHLLYTLTRAAHTPPPPHLLPSHPTSHHHLNFPHSLRRQGRRATACSSTLLRLTRLPANLAGCTLPAMLRWHGFGRVAIALRGTSSLKHGSAAMGRAHYRHHPPLPPHP